jgi:hypothetical protein
METEIYKCSLVNAESIGKRGWEKGGREDCGKQGRRMDTLARYNNVMSMHKKQKISQERPIRVYTDIRQ